VNNASNALVIFIKNPQKGHVKTRLAAAIGEDRALVVYQELLQITKNVTDQVACYKQVWYSKYVESKDLWPIETYSKHLQVGADLGARMQNAFKEAFTRSFEKVVIIGSDCVDLSPSIIDRAFQLLEDQEVVIGPARDGGYYLLGMASFYPALLRGKRWSSPSVLKYTLIQLNEAAIPYQLLPKLNDIDTIDDIKHTPKLNLKLL